VELSVERAFSMFGLTATCRPGELRRRYNALAREWHPDRRLEPPEVRAEATARMAEINAAYRVARQYLRRMRAAGSSARRPTSGPSEVRSAGVRDPWRSWRREPWVHASATSDRLAARTGKALVAAAFVVAAGEIARRALPNEWDLYVMLATVTGVTAWTVVVLCRGTE
jgi:DnaJ-like protein